jgi:aspartyl/asparaginyl beta-hydroxylase (cupin superfamily)
MSEAEAEQKLALNRFDLAAVGAKADHRFRAGDHRAAAAFYSMAARIARERGVSDRASASLAERASNMARWLAERFRHHLIQAVARSRASSGDFPPRFAKALQILLGDRPRDSEISEFPQLPKLFFYPDLPLVDFVDPDIFAWRPALEAHFPAMREEAVRLLADPEAFSPYVTKMAHRPQGDTHRLLENADWSSFYLWQNGEPVVENASRCPTIFRALTDSAPLFDVANRSPSAYLSLLRPGAHIPTHTGMLNCRYICHLPLIVPPGCGLRVGRRTFESQEGRLLAFDDTVEHEAWNRGSEDRLILLFEVWVPDLGDEEKQLIRALLEAVDSYR